jgi:hypothetical protein
MGNNKPSACPGPLEIVEKQSDAVARALENELENESGFR